MPRSYQTIRGFGVVSVLSSDTMGQSPPRVHVHWHTRFGPATPHGPDTAYPQFRPLKKALFSTAAAPPFWIAETWFLLRNLGYYSPLKPCSESGHFRKFLFLAFWNPWISQKKSRNTARQNIPKPFGVPRVRATCRNLWTPKVLWDISTSIVYGVQNSE